MEADELMGKFKILRQVERNILQVKNDFMQVDSRFVQADRNVMQVEKALVLRKYKLTENMLETICKLPKILSKLRKIRYK